jgi:hypothetical protein
MPPVVVWYSEDNTVERTILDFGTVDANSFKPLSADPDTPDDPAYPTTFLLWNNRYHAVDNPTANTVAVADMESTTVKVLSLVRDGFGDIDPNLSYQATGPVAGGALEREANLSVIFYDSTRLSGSGQWGSMAANGTTWTASTWKDISGTIATPVISYSGANGVISGGMNTANPGVNTANYSKMKFRIFVKPEASAGLAEFIVRVSYSFTG